MTTATGRRLVSRGLTRRDAAQAFGRGRPHGFLPDPTQRTTLAK